MSAFAGIANISIDGVYYQIAGEASYSPFTISYEEKIGMSGYAGTKAKFEVAEVTAELFDIGTFQVTSFQNQTSSTINLELINGKQVILTNATIKGKVDVNTMEGTFKVTYIAAIADEIT